MNFKIRILRDNIIKLINEAEFPVEVIRLVLIEILTEVDKQANAQVLKEANEEKEGEE